MGGDPVAEDAVPDRLCAAWPEDVQVRVGRLEAEEAVLVPVWLAQDELQGGDGVSDARELSDTTPYTGDAR